MIADISVTSTFPDTPELARRLSDIERRVMTQFEGKMLDGYQDDWTGWQYKGRPDGAPRNVSMQAWKSRVQSTDQGAALIIENKARDYRTKTRAYVAYVHRAGTQKLEHVVQMEKVQRLIFPELVKALAAAIADGHKKPGPTRKIRTGKSGTVRKTVEM